MDDIQQQIQRLGAGLDRDDIYSAMLALRDMGSRAVAPLIEVLLNRDERYILRCRAAGTLAMLRSVKAIGPLIYTLGDDDVQVRWHAVRALVSLGGRQAIGRLRQMSLSDDGEFSITPTLKISMREEAKKAIKELEASSEASSKEH